MIEGKNRGKQHNIIVMAEGVDIKPHELAAKLQDRTGIETKLVVLGYIQRGGAPTAYDRMLASRLGYYAVRLLQDGVKNRAVGVRGDVLTDYDLAEALLMKSNGRNDLMELAEVLA